MAIILAIPNDAPPLPLDRGYPTIFPGMRIVCPSCSAAYEVPDSSVTAGRVVRCARCQGEWMPVQPAAAPPEAEAQPPPPQRPVPEPAPEPPLAATPRRSAMARLAAHPVRPQRSMLLRLAWAGSIAVLVMAVGASFAWRDRIVSAWPPSAHAYAALGLHPQKDAR